MSRYHHFQHVADPGKFKRKLDAEDARLAADTLPVGDLPLCRVLLMRDRRYAWLVLVPKREGLVEVVDLSAEERAVLWQEVDAAAEALRAVAPCDKLNLGALGNIVRQLHVHVVARGPARTRVGEAADLEARG